MLRARLIGDYQPQIVSTLEISAWHLDDPDSKMLTWGFKTVVLEDVSTLEISAWHLDDPYSKMLRGHSRRSCLKIG